MPRLLDSFLDLLDLLDTPFRELFRRPRQLAIVFAIGIVTEAIAEYRHGALAD